MVLASALVARLQAATAATGGATRAVGRDRGDVLNAADLDAGTREGAEGRLRARAGGLRAVAAGGTHFDVEAADAQLLALDRDVLRGQHGSVRRRLIAVSLDLHAAGHLRDGLTPRGVGDVHEGVVERRVDVADRHDDLTLLLRDADLQVGHLCNLGRSHGDRVCARERGAAVRRDDSSAGRVPGVRPFADAAAAGATLRSEPGAGDGDAKIKLVFVHMNE